jgi:hypothetical protein
MEALPFIDADKMPGAFTIHDYSTNNWFLSHRIAAGNAVWTAPRPNGFGLTGKPNYYVTESNTREEQQRPDPPASTPLAGKAWSAGIYARKLDTYPALGIAALYHLPGTDENYTKPQDQQGYYWRTGHMAITGQAMPSGNALRLYSRLGATRIPVTVDGKWGTGAILTKTANGFRILGYTTGLEDVYDGLSPVRIEVAGAPPGMTKQHAYRVDKVTSSFREQLDAGVVKPTGELVEDSLAVTSGYTGTTFWVETSVRQGGVFYLDFASAARKETVIHGNRHVTSARRIAPHLRTAVLCYRKNPHDQRHAEGECVRTRWRRFAVRR